MKLMFIRGVAPNDKWNDAAGNWNLKFIAEYDNPILLIPRLRDLRRV